MHYFNVTNTAKFLSCTSTALTPILTPVTKTTLSPVTQTRYTTVYETVMPAACETGQWMATYTVTETCTGKPSDYVPSVIPPGFVVTTVSCPVCQPATAIEITCPGVQPTGYPTVGITGNGVTATITATPAGYPMGNPGAYPTKFQSHVLAPAAQTQSQCHALDPSVLTQAQNILLAATPALLHATVPNAQALVPAPFLALALDAPLQPAQAPCHALAPARAPSLVPSQSPFLAPAPGALAPTLSLSSHAPDPVAPAQVTMAPLALLLISSPAHRHPRTLSPSS
ncbi:hypothetical protein GL218_02309 [Daldinia childiae]|uniref:uncharacterized protein n=1 Tax=Daldinia childiae TaxID=326645 RepID=UPI001446A840|nr:uncharacterized protein GL218_02309 [Daldinia childiae]KAF3063918.1 hypothetical protein GL218_02309 [Daldinia childiae]